MVEYASVRSSLYDIDSLVTQLNERAGDGWEVVQILPTGGDVTAVLRRSPGSDASAADMAAAEGAAFAATGAGEVATDDQPPVAAVEEIEAIAVVEDLDTGEVIVAEEVAEVAPAEEPPGWAAAPAVIDTSAEEAAPEAPAAEEATPEGPAAEGLAAAGLAQEATAPPPAPAPVAPEAPPAPPPPAQAIPAGWYPDPSGRFELRYWDGNAWTEHVARQGQMYTDPPVA